MFFYKLFFVNQKMNWVVIFGLLIFSSWSLGFPKADMLKLKLFQKMTKLPIDRPIIGPSISFCSGEIVDGRICVYKCKVCDMPRKFKVDYRSFIFSKQFGKKLRQLKSMKKYKG